MEGSHFNSGGVHRGCRGFRGNSVSPPTGSVVGGAYLITGGGEGEVTNDASDINISDLVEAEETATDSVDEQGKYVTVTISGEVEGNDTGNMDDGEKEEE